LSTVLPAHDEAGRQPVPSCPGWTVRDVIAHLTEICRGMVTRLSPGLAAPDVPSLDGLPLPSLLAEWERCGDQLDSILRLPEHTGRGAILVMDALTHELDVRVALGLPLPASHPAYPGSFDVVVDGLSRSIRSLGLPALRLQAPAASWTAGVGEPAVTVSGPVPDLYRCLAGRRTRRQIEELAWSASPDLWMPAFTWGPFQPPDTPAE
jgi:uncharacterized protein (TIGR03083 family)